MKANNKKISWLTRAAAIVFALLVWQGVAMAVGHKFLLASPLDVAVRLCGIWREEGFFARVFGSLGHIALGFLLGLGVGSLLAVVSGRFRIVETMLAPFMTTAKTVPVASFIVIALIWLRSSSLSVFISFLIVLPVIYANVLGGIKSIPREMNEMAQVFRLSMPRRLVYIWLPNIKPYLLSACGASLGMAWKAGVAAEVIGLASGSLGEALYEAKVYYNTVDLFAWTVVIVLVSVVFERAVMFLLKRGFLAMERV